MADTYDTPRLAAPFSAPPVAGDDPWAERRGRVRRAGRQLGGGLAVWLGCGVAVILDSNLHTSALLTPASPASLHGCMLIGALLGLSLPALLLRYVIVAGGVPSAIGRIVRLAVGQLLFVATGVAFGAGFGYYAGGRIAEAASFHGSTAPIVRRYFRVTHAWGTRRDDYEAWVEPYAGGGITSVPISRADYDWLHAADQPGTPRDCIPLLTQTEGSAVRMFQPIRRSHFLPIDRRVFRCPAHTDDHWN